jgi:hypothetical protein
LCTVKLPHAVAWLRRFFGKIFKLFVPKFWIFHGFWWKDWVMGMKIDQEFIQKTIRLFGTCGHCGRLCNIVIFFSWWMLRGYANVTVCFRKDPAMINFVFKLLRTGCTKRWNDIDFCFTYFEINKKRFLMWRKCIGSFILIWSDMWNISGTCNVNLIFDANRKLEVEKCEVLKHFTLFNFKLIEYATIMIAMQSSQNRRLFLLKLLQFQWKILQKFCKIIKLNFVHAFPKELEQKIYVWSLPRI